RCRWPARRTVLNVTPPWTSRTSAASCAATGSAGKGDADTGNILSSTFRGARIPMRKDEEFSESDNSVIERAELSDKRYPIKGINVWRPYGWAIMKLIDQAMREEFDSTGHGEVNFPVLIPETEFQKEAEHVKGFEGDVFWVTRGGLNELDVRLVLRPTSEP